MEPSILTHEGKCCMYMLLLLLLCRSPLFMLHVSHYASVGRALEAYSSCRRVCVCVSVCYSFTRFSAQLLKTRR